MMSSLLQSTAPQFLYKDATAGAGPGWLSYSQPAPPAATAPTPAPSTFDVAKQQALGAPAAEAGEFAIRGRQSLVNADLKNKALNMALLTLGAGAGARGLVGLYSLLRRNAGGPAPRGVGSRVIDVPYAVDREDDEKVAWGENAPDVVQSTLKATRDWLQGRGAQNWKEHPLALPTMTLSGLGGLGLGWKGIDTILNRRRKVEREQELINARREYDEALMSQYTRTGPSTKAAQVNDELDGLYEDWQEKRAILREATGVGLTATALIALLTGTGVYDMVKKRQHAAVLGKAQALRQRQLQQMSPTVMFARPVPIEQTKRTPKVDNLKEIPIEQELSTL